jgi:uncharacterized iron-regulated protein
MTAPKWFLRYLVFCALGFSCALGALAQDRTTPDAVDLSDGLSLDTLVGKLAAKRVVFIGEIHDRYDHHLNQLEIIKRLHELDPTLAIGVEYFQQPFQSQVDDYIAGRISEAELLRRTEYFTRWGYDYRLYAPIFRYAREQHIPVRALNVPTALVSAVARVGISALSEKERAYLPKSIEPADEGYRRRLSEAFQEHQTPGVDAFNHFVEAQLVWDEGMAESAAAYLSANTDRLVILAGAGHIEFGSGIPSRLERRTHATYAIVLSSGEEIEPDMADYVVLSKRQELPPAGVLNVNLEDKSGECRIAALSPGGAAQNAGLKKGDVLLSLGGQAVKTAADAKLALWDKKPGDMVRIQVRRARFLRTNQLSFDVTLGASKAPFGMP